MVNPINNDSAKLKPVEGDRRLKNEQPDNKEKQAEKTLAYDSVELSATSKQLDALKASLQNIPEINEARVMYFKAEIESGKYQINSDKIAQNMLNNNVEMA